MKQKSKKVTAPIPAFQINFLAIQVNIARAYEIALLGDHSITLCYYEDWGDKERTVKQDDLYSIAQFFNCSHTDNGEMLLEVLRPQFDDIRSTMRSDRFETMAIIKGRVELARDNPRPEAMNESCWSLLKTAYDRLGLSMQDCQTIYSVAQTIAQLAGSDTIKPEHIAEAMQYRALLETENVKRFIKQG